MQKKLMLIDGNSIVNRAFYGIPLLTNSEGRYTNAVYGFLNILFKLMDEEKPDYLGIAFDLHAPTFRHKEYAEYKGTRKGMPEELREQMPLLKEVLTALNIMQFEVEGYEADDILGTLSKKGESMGLAAVVVSGDRDLLQLASDTLKIRIPKTLRGKTTVEDYYEEDVKEKYGVTPKEFIDLKALMGDASDNIPGVPGIGEKTATKIIQQFHSIEEAIKNVEQVLPKKASQNLQEFQQKAILSKFLAEIVTDMPIEVDLEKMSTDNPYSEGAYDLFKRLEFKSLLPRVESISALEQFSRAESLYKKLSNAHELKLYINSIDKEEATAYALSAENGLITAIGFFHETIGGVYAEVSDSLKIEDLLEITKEFFVSEDYFKIAHDAKRDIKLLRRYGIEESSVVFDTAIAGYVLNSTREAYEYDDIASEFLNEIYTSELEVLGKGKNKLSISQLDENERINYVVRQAEVAYRAYPIMNAKLEENEQQNLYYEIELPLIYVLADMENYGIKINQKELIDYRSNLEASIETLTAEIYDMAGEEFNINSPKQLGTILFEKLGLPGGKKTKTGGYSTGAEILEKLSGDSPIIEKIMLFRQLSKLKSTYADGLLNVMDEKTNKIFSTFNQTITATGRISSTEPNLQNIPIRLSLGRELRKVFIPTDDNFLFLDADYSQIELRVLAHMAGDETLCNAFLHNQDIHRLTASQVFNIPFDEVTSAQRSNAKAVNFGIVYGIGAFSLSQDLGITRREAENYINGYFDKYPKIRTYMDKTINDARNLGYVSTIFNRRRAMPELNAQNFVQRSFGERVAMNMPIQGSAADIIKIAMVKVHKSLKKSGLKSRLILQVHDELLLEVHKDEVDEVSSLLKHEMEHAVELNVPLEVDVHSGKNWFEAK